MEDFNLDNVRAAVPELTDKEWDKLVRVHLTPPVRKQLEEIEFKQLSGPQQGGTKSRALAAILAEFQRMDSEKEALREAAKKNQAEAVLQLAEDANQIAGQANKLAIDANRIASDSAGVSKTAIFISIIGAVAAVVSAIVAVRAVS